MRTKTEQSQESLDEFSAEQKEFSDFEAIIENNAEIFKRMWRLENGEGAYVIRTIKDAIDVKDIKTSDRYKKKKISIALRKVVFERDKYRCKHCETHLDLTVDHINPESKGGETALDNFQTLCRSCNSKKGIGKES